MQLTQNQITVCMFLLSHIYSEVYLYVDVCKWDVHKYKETPLYIRLISIHSCVSRLSNDSTTYTP